MYIGGETDHPRPVISGNSITNMDGDGIYVDVNDSAPSGDVDDPTAWITRIIDNTVQRVGLTGIDVINTIPDIRSNVVADTDLDKGVDTGILVNSAQDQGRVDCNTLSGNPTAVQYAGNPDGKDP